MDIMGTGKQFGFIGLERLKVWSADKDSAILHLDMLQSSQ